MGKKSNFEIILGTYEEFLLGYRYNGTEDELVQTFADHGHNGSIRCISRAKNFVATGSSDDRIIIYDFKKRIEHRSLLHHNGTVNCLEFTTEGTHLISGGDDGLLAITRVGSWMLEKSFEKAHKGAAILSIAVHPSSKLLLTLGADRTLRTWNLIKGRLAYTINLNNKCKDIRNLHLVKWGPDGIHFVLVGGVYTDIWNTESGGIVHSLEHTSRVSSCVWKNENTLIMGYESGEIATVDLEKGEIVKHSCQESRIKCLELFKSKIITGTSNGDIKILNKRFKEAGMVKAGCRFTCMTVIPCLEDEVKSENEGGGDDVVEVEIPSEESVLVEESEVESKHKKKKKAKIDQNGSFEDAGEKSKGQKKKSKDDLVEIPTKKKKKKMNMTM